MNNYFELLGVSEDASDEDIKKQYRLLSKKYHPDINPEGAEKFKEIAEAYDVLSDPDKKIRYQQQKNNPFDGGPFEEFFKNMYSNGPEFHAKRKVADKIIKLPVTVLESFKGQTKQIDYQRNIACADCYGNGGDNMACIQCQGSGFFFQVLGSGFFQQKLKVTCPSCHGKGKIITKYCGTCSGVGTKSNFETITINIPKGIDDGQFMKLEGKGDFIQGMYGDLVIQTAMQQDGEFQKIGNDLVYNLTLNIETIQEEFFHIPHPDGILKIESPQVIDTNKPLRLKNKGFPNGDMFVKMNFIYDKSK